MERIVLECANYLVLRGHDVNVFASTFEGKNCGYKRCAVPIRAWPPAFAGRSFFSAASRQIDLRDFDVLNTHGCICPFDGVQWIHSLHAAWIERCNITRPRWSKRWIAQKINPLHRVLLQLERRHLAERRYRRLTATTSIVRDDLGRFYGVPPEDVDIVPNGFNPEEFNPAHRKVARQRMREELGLSDDDIVLLFVANELQRKGFPTLLGAVEKLADRRFKIIAAGRPPETEIKRLAAKYGLVSQVLAVGSLRAVADLHAAADLMVLPTQYEAFCLAILESLGSGLPVITTIVPGARDAIVDGTNGLLLNDPSDAGALADIIRGAIDGDFLAKASAAAPKTVCQFQWPTVLRRYEQVLADASRVNERP